MAEIIQNNSKRKYPKLDMTPMADLAFLLLTFFVLAASLSKPKAMEIIYPK
jgi:biopolymer transport protein ExbD